MVSYVDRNRRTVYIGDILKYDEGDYARSIEEVIEIGGEPHAITRVGAPEWTSISDLAPIHLEYFTVFAGCRINKLMHAEVIGNVVDNPEMLTPKYAEILWPEEEPEESQ